MQASCERVGVPLVAAALQFSLRAPFVDSTVVGVSAPERVGQTVELCDVPIPDPLWAELDALAPARDCWLDS
jgi:D-threo-aldose 1-dehydrogenase